jgi:hypothetical protein
MCKTCVGYVYIVSKSCGHEHILCAASRLCFRAPAYKRGLSTKHAQMTSPHFSTFKIRQFPLLSGLLSTQYTGPTTSTTKLY